ncbi:MAG: serine hydrolase domain-containing protein [Pseudomonadota bacterium]
MSICAKIRIIFSSFLLAIATCHAQPATQQIIPEEARSTGIDPAAVSADFQTLMELYGAPSLSVAMISNGEITYAQSFGFGDLEMAQPATFETQYGIGSIVKSFTSALIGTLEAEGKVDLGAHPSTYVSNLNFKSGDLSENLTIATLLSQTSGLPYMDGSLAFFPEREQADLASRLAHFEASCRVGNCWSYNNLNFIMLDMIAESVTGQSKADLFKDRFLQPLGMKHTLSETAMFEASKTAATGYAMIEGAPVSTATEYLYDEQIYATASDMARWISAWMDNTNPTIPNDYATSAISMQAIDNGAPPTREEPGTYLFGYGYGWNMKSVEGHYVVSHGGNENGFSSQVLFVPAADIGFVALTNQQNSILPYLVNDMLFRKSMQLPETPIEDYPVVVSEATGFLSEDDTIHSVNNSAPMTLEVEDITGTYVATAYGSINVDFTSDVLMLKTPAADFILKHLEGNSFGLATMKPIPLGINIDFFEIEFGPETLTVNIANPPVVFTKNPEN